MQLGSQPRGDEPKTASEKRSFRRTGPKLVRVVGVAQAEALCANLVLVGIGPNWVRDRETGPPPKLGRDEGVGVGDSSDESPGSPAVSMPFQY